MTGSRKAATFNKKKKKKDREGAENCKRQKRKRSTLFDRLCKQVFFFLFFPLRQTRRLGHDEINKIKKLNEQKKKKKAVHEIKPFIPLWDTDNTASGNRGCIFLCFFSSAARKQPLPQKMTKYRGGQHDSDQAAPTRARLTPLRHRFAAAAAKLLLTHPPLHLSHNIFQKNVGSWQYRQQEKKKKNPSTPNKQKGKKIKINSSKRGRDRKEEKSGGGGDVLVFTSPIMFLMYKLQINVWYNKQTNRCACPWW